IWSPLASGILTGKYNEGIPEGRKRKKIGIVKKLQAYAKEKFDTSIAALAIAWCLKNKNVSTVLLGATSVQQITENLKALDVARKITKTHLAEIEEIVKNKPKQDGDWGRNLEVTIETD
ncbi:aldo/keto family dehydrogenase, partial [Reticulomyxa filosa]